jgi:hypothetical protein
MKCVWRFNFGTPKTFAPPKLIELVYEVYGEVGMNEEIVPEWCSLSNGEGQMSTGDLGCQSVITEDLKIGLLLTFVKTGDSLLMSFIKF